jgi:hypothetical protein
MGESVCQNTNEVEKFIFELHVTLPYYQSDSWSFLMKKGLSKIDLEIKSKLLAL